MRDGCSDEKRVFVGCGCGSHCCVYEAAGAGIQENNAIDADLFD
jgi:hypothetical protein